VDARNTESNPRKASFPLCLAITIGAVALGLMFSAGAALISPAVQMGDWNFYLMKYADPYRDMVPPAIPGSHESNIGFRLLVPCVAHAIGIGEKGTEVLLAGLSFIFILIVVTGMRRVAPSVGALASIAVLLVGMHPWSLFTSAVTGYFDGFAFTFLAAACFTRRPVLAGFFVMFAGLCDERGLLGACFLPWVHASLFEEDDPRVMADLGSFIARNKGFHAVALGWALYFGLRSIFAAVFKIHAYPATWGLPGADSPIYIVLAALMVFQLGWVPLLWEMRPSALRGASWINGAWIAVLLFSLLASCIVRDLTRSMSYSFPVIFIAICRLLKGNPRRRAERLLLIAAVGSLLIPNFEMLKPITGRPTIRWMKPMAAVVPHVREFVKKELGIHELESESH